MAEEKKGLGPLVAALNSKAEKSSGEAKGDDGPDFEKLYEDACDEMMNAVGKHDVKRFRRALRAAMKTNREKD